MNLQFFSRSFLFVFHLISIASWHFPEITLFTSTSLSKCHDVTKRSSVVSFLRCSLASISTLVLCSYLTNSLARFGLSLYRLSRSKLCFARLCFQQPHLGPLLLRHVRVPLLVIFLQSLHYLQSLLCLKLDRRDRRRLRFHSLFFCPYVLSFLWLCHFHFDFLLFQLFYYLLGFHLVDSDSTLQRLSRL